MQSTRTQTIGMTAVRVFYSKNAARMFGDRMYVTADGKPLPLNLAVGSPRLVGAHWVDSVPAKEDFTAEYSLMWSGYAAGLGSDLNVCERMFSRFNDYDENPLSAENGGQGVVHASGAHHTSMSVGDLVVVGSKVYIARDQGFELLTFEVPLTDPVAKGLEQRNADYRKAVAQAEGLAMDVDDGSVKAEEDRAEMALGRQGLDFE